MRILLAFVALLFLALPAQAATLYCSPSGGGSGADFNDLCTLPNTTGFVRGNTYVIIEGSYGSKTFSTAESGTTRITIKKASAADSAVAGYSAALHDAQAVFGLLGFRTGYWTIDGVTRNESNWKDHASYGIQATEVRSSRFDYSPNPTECPGDNLTFRYLHVGSEGNTYAGWTGSRSFYLGGFGGGSVACEDWLISRVLIQNTSEVQCVGGERLTYEYTYFYIGWAKEAIRGQEWCKDITVRWSIFEDSCQKDPNNPTGGCTGEIAAWDGPAGGFDGWQVYGNVFFKTTAEVNSSAAVRVGHVSTGPTTSNTKVYNNTIAGLDGWNADIEIIGGTGNECYNNLWYDNVGSVTGCTANSTANNRTVGTNPFVNYAGGNFRLSGAQSPMTALGAPYNVDIDGVTRNDDIGAFEFSTGGSAPGIPTNLHIVQEWMEQLARMR